MRHRSKTVKLQRDKAHRESLMRNLAASLIEHGLPADTPALLAEAVGHPHQRLLLGSNQLAQRSTKVLFEEIAPASAERQGGYCRIIKLGQRRSDSAPMALIEWVDALVTTSGETAGE